MKPLIVFGLCIILLVLSGCADNENLVRVQNECPDFCNQYNLTHLMMWAGDNTCACTGYLKNETQRTD
jgi:hypothetical protein